MILFLQCSRSSTPDFSGDRAFDYLQKQCQLGPRNPGSEGHEKARNYLLDILKSYTNLVKEENFSFSAKGGSTAPSGQAGRIDSLKRKEFNSTNIIASFYPEETKRVLLCAHWDSRPFADQEKDSSLHSQAILGANDGASGVAVLLEIASIISKKKPKWGVDVVLFDAEDYGSEQSGIDYCLGSKYFAKNLGEYRPFFAILLDMVGDKDLAIYKEGYSQLYAERVNNLIWKTAFELKIENFKDSVKHFIVDDHLSLISAGIPCADLIDFDYPYWHTLSDTPDKCSPRNLEKVGKVITKILYDGKL